MNKQNILEQFSFCQLISDLSCPVCGVYETIEASMTPKHVLLKCVKCNKQFFYRRVDSIE